MARRNGTTAALAFAAAALTLGLSGCSLFGGSAPSPSASSAPTASGTAAPTPEAPPVLRPELSAAENLAYFDSVNAAVVAANAEAGGRDFIDALVAGGFDKAAMEVTADRTTVDLEADSVQFAVRFQDECLVGQYGPKSGGYHGAVRPLLGTGDCLVGETRPIDW